ncbi:MAG TPA: hypothetical protein PKI92_03625, partial [Candidatus Woesebacteria bacterium]|nr:hypothetical protein [Candidatus Woesebacteria bacterium]
MVKKVKIYGGLIKNQDEWSYYFGAHKDTFAFGPKTFDRSISEKMLNDEFQQAKEQFGEDFEVE